jgi:hypothetical protein
VAVAPAGPVVLVAHLQQAVALRAVDVELPEAHPRQVVALPVVAAAVPEEHPRRVAALPVVDAAQPREEHPRQEELRVAEAPFRRFPVVVLLGLRQRQAAANVEAAGRLCHRLRRRWPMVFIASSAAMFPWLC